MDGLRIHVLPSIMSVRLSKNRSGGHDRVLLPFLLERLVGFAS